MRDVGSEYGRLLAERDRLIADGADPSDLEMPLPPPAGLTELRGNPVCWICEKPIRDGYAGSYVRVSLDDGRVVDIDDVCFEKVDEPKGDDE